MPFSRPRCYGFDRDDVAPDALELTLDPSAHTDDANPGALHRVITQESKTDGPRMDWLVERHVRPVYEQATAMFSALVEAGHVPDIPVAHLYYILTGAGPSIFVLAPECRRLSGIDPHAPDAVEAHADAVITLLFGR